MKNKSVLEAAVFVAQARQGDVVSWAFSASSGDLTLAKRGLLVLRDSVRCPSVSVLHPGL